MATEPHPYALRQWRLYTFDEDAWARRRKVEHKTVLFNDVALMETWVGRIAPDAWYWLQEIDKTTWPGDAANYWSMRTT